MEYRGEKVIAKVIGKICSYEEDIPDCVCNIYLTDLHIFVSEDNYDGTFTDHYVYHLSNVIDVLMDRPYETTLPFGKLLGSHVRTGAIRYTEQESIDVARKEKFFTIVSRTDDGSRKKIYFILNSLGKGMFIREFKKMRKYI